MALFDKFIARVMQQLATASSTANVCAIRRRSQRCARRSFTRWPRYTNIDILRACGDEPAIPSKVV
jgi:hypothetical protein